MIDQIKHQLELLWLDSILPDLIVMDLATQTAIYDTGDVPVSMSMATLLEVKEVIISDNVKGFKFYCYA
jgi:hypothetical protein